MEYQRRSVSSRRALVGESRDRAGFSPINIEYDRAVLSTMPSPSPSAVRADTMMTNSSSLLLSPSSPPTPDFWAKNAGGLFYTIKVEKQVWRGDIEESSRYRLRFRLPLSAELQRISGLSELVVCSLPFAILPQTSANRRQVEAELFIGRCFSVAVLISAIYNYPQSIHSIFRQSSAIPPPPPVIT